MNQQREILVTVTYNELGIIIDTKAEVREPGEWIEKVDSSGNKYATCSRCCRIQYAGYLNYCPYCGSPMKRSETYTNEWF